MDKEIALQQLHLIQKTIEEGGHIFPCTKQMVFIWSFLSAVSITLPFWVASASQLLALSQPLIVGLTLFITLTIGFSSNIFFINRTNTQTGYMWTKPLKVVALTYTMTFSMTALLSIALAYESTSFYIPALWLFSVGLCFFIENALSKSFLGQYGVVLMTLALIFMILCLYLTSFDTSLSTRIFLSTFGTLLELIFISGGLLFFGIKLHFTKKLDV